MDLQHSLQDVIRCHLCDTACPFEHCDICHINLCESCVVEHLADEFKKHRVVPFQSRGSTPKCPKHSAKLCELHCKECNIPVCPICISSGKHKQHKVEDILKILTNQRNLMQTDLKELETSIYPRYLEASSTITIQRADGRKLSQKLKIAINKQGETLHTEIDAIIQNMQSDIDDMDAQHLAEIEKKEEAITQTITEIRQIIQDLKKLLDTSDVCLVSKYQSKNEELGRMPGQFEVKSPTFTPQEINKEQIRQLFGSLSKQEIIYPLIDEPRILANIATGYKGISLHSVSCANNREIWTCGEDKNMRLYNLQGELVKSVQTESGNWPQDITVARSGDLVFIDSKEKSINLVSNTNIQKLIKLLGWKPLNVCSTSTDDLLVVMESDDGQETKVVRYFASTEIGSIQYDDENRPLYSSGSSEVYPTKYLSENRNLDVCVADCLASAVVVVNANGRLRFKFTNPPFVTHTFRPFGITTDSKGRILISECHNICILDQDGNFLRYINNSACNIRYPWGLSVDSRDNLFVAVSKGEVKKIQYYK